MTMRDAAVDDWMTIHFGTMMMSACLLSRKTKSRTAVAAETAKRAVFVNDFCTCSNYHCWTLTRMAAKVVIGP